MILPADLAYPLYQPDSRGRFSQSLKKGAHGLPFLLYLENTVSALLQRTIGLVIIITVQVGFNRQAFAVLPVDIVEE